MNKKNDDEAPMLIQRKLIQRNKKTSPKQWIAWYANRFREIVDNCKEEWIKLPSLKKIEAILYTKTKKKKKKKN